jgi:hypothetical protein
MGHFQMECDKCRMAPSNPNHWLLDIKLSSTSFVFLLQYCPIKMLYLVDMF